MSFGILQGNQLYKKIEQKDAFRAFSRGYNQSLISRNTDNMSAFNKTVQKTIASSSHTIDLRKNSNQQVGRSEQPFARSLTNNLEKANHSHFLHMLSAKLNFNDLQGYSKTQPMRIQVEATSNEPSIGQQFDYAMPSNSRNSQTELFQSKILRKNNFFKLKSCLFKGQLHYDAPTEQSDFSTLECRRKSQILRSFRDRSQQKYRQSCEKSNKANNHREASEPMQTRYSNGMLASKYSKFAREGVKSTLQHRGRALKQK